MSEEIVKYHNDLNTIIMRSWTAEEMNFFFTILSKVREKGTKKLTFKSHELKRISSDARKFRWEETIVSAAKKITQLTYFERKDGVFRVMTLFEIFEVDLVNQLVEVQVSSSFDYILNRLETQFTMYELAEFTKIKSTYAKSMYRLLKQWRTVGKRDFLVEEFKTLLDTPKSYKTSELDRAVIKPILEQLSPFFKNLKVKKVKAKTKGTPVKSYTFTWKPENAKPVSEDDLKILIDTKQVKEAEKVQEVAPASSEVSKQNLEKNSLDIFFEQVGEISKNYRHAIVKATSVFDPSEVPKMLDFAEKLRKQKDSTTSFGYTAKIVTEWAENNVKTLDKAISFHKANYKIEPKHATKHQKSPVSNVPSWSNSDYVNTTSEETKAELERKKQELLSRMDKSISSLEEPVVLPGQTDIYDFLDEKES